MKKQIEFIRLVALQSSVQRLMHVITFSNQYIYIAFIHNVNCVFSASCIPRLSERNSGARRLKKVGCKIR